MLFDIFQPLVDSCYIILTLLDIFLGDDLGFSFGYICKINYAKTHIVLAVKCD